MAGRVRYCPQGHDTFVTGRIQHQCAVCRRAYNATWRKSPTGRAMQARHNRTYQERHPGKACEQTRRWRLANPEKAKAMVAKRKAIMRRKADLCDVLLELHYNGMSFAEYEALANRVLEQAS